MSKLTLLAKILELRLSTEKNIKATATIKGSGITVKSDNGEVEYDINAGSQDGYFDKVAKGL